MKRRYIIYLLNCMILGFIIGLAINFARTASGCYLIAIFATIALVLHVYSYYKDVKENEKDK